MTARHAEAGADHDGGVVGVIGAKIETISTTHFMKTDPDIGLNVFHQMTQMNGTVGVGQSTCDQNGTHEKALSMVFRTRNE